jgi:hypothetical protein
MVHRLAAQVDKIAAKGPKFFQKFAIFQRRERNDERISNSTVETRISSVKESPGHGRCFAYE